MPYTILSLHWAQLSILQKQPAVAVEELRHTLWRVSKGQPIALLKLANQML